MKLAGHVIESCEARMVFYLPKWIGFNIQREILLSSDHILFFYSFKLSHAQKSIAYEQIPWKFSFW